jgi:hypothetical protein
LWGGSGFRAGVRWVVGTSVPRGGGRVARREIGAGVALRGLRRGGRASGIVVPGGTGVKVSGRGMKGETMGDRRRVMVGRERGVVGWDRGGGSRMWRRVGGRATSRVRGSFGGA